MDYGTALSSAFSELWSTGRVSHTDGLWYGFLLQHDPAAPLLFHTLHPSHQLNHSEKVCVLLCEFLLKFETKFFFLLYFYDVSNA